MTRLIDAGPDLVEYLPAEDTTDEYGTPVTVFGDPIMLTVELHRVSADEVQALGARADVSTPVETVYRFSTATELPDSSAAQVRARGRLWAVVGEPTRQGRSPRTRHTQVVIRALTGSEVTP